MGRVPEIGAGSGLCFSHYAEGVSEVVAAEHEHYLRLLAEHAASASPVPAGHRCKRWKQHSAS